METDDVSVVDSSDESNSDNDSMDEFFSETASNMDDGDAALQ